MTAPVPPQGAQQAVAAGAAWNGQAPPASLELPPRWQPWRAEAERILAGHLATGEMYGVPADLVPWVTWRAGLARRAQELMRSAALHYRPGMALPPELEEARPVLEAEFAEETDREAHRQAVRDAASRKRAAEGWQPPAATASLADELALPRQTHAHRIAGLAGWNHNVLLAGARKSGKTAIDINMCAGLSRSSLRRDPATGADLWTPGWFLGRECYMAGNVAYYNAEMDEDDWRDEFRRLPAESFDPSRIWPLHRRGEPFPVIASDAAREWFVAELLRVRAEVLFIDTWGELCNRNGVRNLSDDAEARMITGGLDEIKRRTYVRMIVVNIHMPHQTGERHLERFKGAGAVGDWADVLWTLTRDEEEVRYLWAEGRAGIRQPEWSLSFDPATGLMSRGATGSRARTARERQRERALAALEAAGKDGINAEPLKDAAGGNRKSAAGEIGKLVAGQTAVMEKQKGSNAKVYYLSRFRQQPATPDPGQ